MKKTTLNIIFFLSIFSIIAQDWKQESFKPEANYFDIIENQKNQLSNLRSSTKRADIKKVKQFERWAYYWKTRINDDGSFPNPMIAFNEWNTYQQKSDIKNNNASDWSLIGPKVIPDSEITSYAGMGRLNVVTFNPTNPNEIWVGAAGGGIWRSDDAGATWIPKGDQIPNLTVSDIVFHPTNPDIIYLASGDFDGRFNPSIGVLKSTDHGESWQITGLNYEQKDFQLISHLLIDPTNPNTIFATSVAGIFKSIDGGANWELKNGTTVFNDIVYKEGSSSVLFATSIDTEFYISTDNGENWTSSSVGLSAAGFGRLDIATTTSDPEFIIGINANSVFKSIDGGMSWSVITKPPTFETQRGYNQTVIIAPDNKDLILLGGVDGWRSIDGGDSWEKYMNGYWQSGDPFFYVHSDHHDLEFLPGSTTEVFSANDGGLFKGDITSNDAWTDLSSGLAITQYYKLAGTPQNADFILAGAQDNDVTHYDGTTWVNRNFVSDGVEALWNYSNSDIAWSCSQFGKLERTTDGWATPTTQLTTPNGAGFVWPLEIDPIDPTTIYGGFNNIYKSTNSGDSWTNLNFPGGTPNVITIAPSNNQVIYVGDGSKVYMTTDGGVNWNNLSLPVQGLIRSIAVNSTVPEEVYICYARYNAGNKVFKSTDSGSNWTNISGTLPNLPANKIVYLTGGDGDLFLGTDIGVFHKNDLATDWELFGEGLPAVVVNDIEIHYGTEKLRVATYGRGIWEIDLQSTSVLEVTEFSENVLEIYPNPTEGKLTIQLKDIEGESNIMIYNLIGGVVENFTTTELSVTKDMSAYSSGIYMIQVKNGNKQIVKKLVVK
ncbi:T9SS type A sorting domain-containing protein [Aquimarina sp. RZ0]|uniref:T9SS type A sorting domain-containing protein n=1 Tax=Aquimarina sp. RZ0 TaxID=2607730 RepID=UPI0011F12804|nr:T9SS type A sorting domain-containing protein [Aquimarina sp. RZ0]KAA1244651.1 T9SS type A sorting domain-containing protein [Aquimarina sp. RZ0]